MEELLQVQGLERAVLGSSLISKIALNAVINGTEAADYYMPCNRDIYNQMKLLCERGESVGIESMHERMVAIGWSYADCVYLAEIAETMCADENVESYIKTIVEKSQLRKVVHLHEKVDGIIKEDEPHDVTMEKIEKEYQKVMYSKAVAKIYTMQECLSDTFHAMENRNNKKIDGVKTGIVALDNIIGYCPNGDLTVIAGRPSQGKTSLMATIIYNLLVGGYRVGYLSLEEKREDLIYRLFCIAEGLNLFQAKKGFLPKRDFPKIRIAAGILSNYHLFIDDNSTQTARTVKSAMRKLLFEDKVDVILSDHLHQHTIDSDNENLEYGRIAQVYKAFGKDHRIPIILGSQLSRPDKKLKKVPRPKMSDLRASGAIEQIVDVLIMIHREETYTKDPEDKGKAELIVEKQRFGPCETAHVRFVNESAYFTDVTTESSW